MKYQLAYPVEHCQGPLAPPRLGRSTWELVGRSAPLLVPCPRVKVRGMDAYRRLARHLANLGMGYPPTEALQEILKECFTPEEAEIALAIPTRVPPLEVSPAEEIAGRLGIAPGELVPKLEAMVRKGLLFKGRTPEGRVGYALQQVGFGFPQAFFWKGEDTPEARRMAELVAKYFNRHVTKEAYAPSPTKAYRYVPLGKTLEPGLQAVFPYHTMDYVIERAQVIAVAHCPCRIVYRMKGKACPHPLEVCLKFDELAEYCIETGLGRPVTKEEALEIVAEAEEAGLVHFVDNAKDGIKHNCNCCGCACWNVGNIRRRKIPRDLIMATYFLRGTDQGECTGCGLCAEVCPVEAVRMEGDLPEVDRDWCIGCGVCVARCPTGAAYLIPRPDRALDDLPEAFSDLHRRIIEEKAP